MDSDDELVVSPIDTLTFASTIQDRIEAYALLSARLRQEKPPDQFRERSRPLLASISRDLALASDFSPTSPDGVYYESGLLSLLAQHALLTISLIFASSLYHDLCPSALLDNVLVQAISFGQKELKVINSCKIYSLVFSILSTQTLLPRNIIPATAPITQTLVHGLSRPPYATMAFKAIHHLLAKHPHMKQELLPLLDRVLHQINGKNVQDAVHALAGYAVASLFEPSSGIASGVTQFIRTHRGALLLLIEQSLKPSETSQEPLYWSFPFLASLAILTPTSIFATSTLLKFIFEVLPLSGDHAVKSVTGLHDEVWKVLAWTLLRHFNKGNTGKEVSLEDRVKTFHKAFKVLSQGRKHRVGICVVAVALCVQLPADAPAPIKTSFRASTIAGSLEVVSALLQSHGTKSVVEGIRLLSSLTGGRPTQPSTDRGPLEPYDFFSEQLLDGTLLDIGLSDPFTSTHAPPKSRNEVILNKIPHLSEEEIIDHWDALAELWDIACRQSVLLSREYEGRQDKSQYKEEVMATLCSTLQALLLPQTQLTQETFSKLISKATVVATLAKSTARLSDGAPTADANSGAMEAQLSRLAFIQRIWRVFRNVFAPSDPPAPSDAPCHAHTPNAGSDTANALVLASEIILASLLSGPFDLNKTEVKAAWCDLCSDLVSVGVSPTLLHVLWNRRSAVVGSEEVVKTLWGVIGLRYAVGTWGWESWVDLVAFLTIPFLHPRPQVEGKTEALTPEPGSDVPTGYFRWKLTVAEQQTWTTLLRHTLHHSQRVAIKHETVISHLLEGIQLLTPSVDEERHPFYQARLCLAQVLGHIGEAALSDDHSGSIRRLANSAITRLYCEEGRELGLEALDRFFKPWTEQPSIPEVDRGSLEVKVLGLLSSFQPSICQWIEDADNVLDQDGHMRLISSVYRPAMSFLALLTPSVDVLESFERLMISPFGKEHNASPLGPQTFIAFWRGQLPASAFSQPCSSDADASGWWANSVIKQAFKDHFPSKFERLGTFLRACADIFPGEEDLVDGLGLSLGSEVSFASPMTVISDSQPTPFRRGTLPVRKAITDPDLARYPELEELVGFGYQITANAVAPSNDLADSPALGNKRRSTIDSSSRQLRPSTPTSHGTQLSLAKSSQDPAMIGHAHERRGQEVLVTPTRSRPNPRLCPEGRSWSANDGVPRRGVGGIDANYHEQREDLHTPVASGGLVERPKKRRRHTVNGISSSTPRSRTASSRPFEYHSEQGGNDVVMELTSTEPPQALNFTTPGVLVGKSSAGILEEDLECDYESWEAGHSIEGLREIREEMHLGALQSSSLDISDDLDSPNQDGGPAIPFKATWPDQCADRSDQGESPTVSDRLFGVKSKLRDRSMTEPAFEHNPASPSNTFSHPSPRRLRRAKTSSEAQLTALESVYNLVSNTAEMDGISQIPVAELMRARMIANRIGEVLDEQVVSKLERGRRGRDEEEITQ